MIDLRVDDMGMLRDDLYNLRVINHYLGGLAVIRDEILKLFEKVPPQQTIRILDMATGSADHPVAIAELARRQQRRLEITAVDKSSQILEVAREFISGYPEITLEQHNILALPYDSGSFDMVLCSLALHHFSERDAVRVLSLMKTISSCGFIVNDLCRSWTGAWMTWVYAHLSTRNPMSRHDAYISILRGFTPTELSEMARAAGIEHFSVKKRPFFRLILSGEPQCMQRTQSL